MFFVCAEVIPQGLTIVRYFDIWMNQHAYKTFYLFYNGNLFGTPQFKTMSDFDNWMLWHCCDTEVLALVNGCYATINGFKINLN